MLALPLLSSKSTAYAVHAVAAPNAAARAMDCSRSGPSILDSSEPAVGYGVQGPAGALGDQECSAALGSKPAKTNVSCAFKTIHTMAAAADQTTAADQMTAADCFIRVSGQSVC